MKMKGTEMSEKEQLFNIETMRRLSIMDLSLVYDAVARCIEATYNANNEPRAWDQEREAPTPGGKEVERLQSYLTDVREALIEIVRETPSEDSLEVDLKASLLLNYQCECGTDNFSPFLEIIANAISESQGVRQTAMRQVLAAAS